MSEISHLKELIAKLQAKVERLEAVPAPVATPSQTLRLVLMGPPGAGQSQSQPLLPFSPARRHLERLS